ncbi:hypothetical protein CRUP_022687 [Coryphaenoides rupestris]|nr:hypothetical protein CRUP_022687 [Coryphaenoides rupestris]
MVGEMEGRDSKPKPSPDYLMQLMNDRKLMSSLPNFCGIFHHLERLLDEDGPYSILSSSEARVSEARVSEARVSEARVSEARVSEARGRCSAESVEEVSSREEVTLPCWLPHATPRRPRGHLSCPTTHRSPPRHTCTLEGRVDTRARSSSVGGHIWS